MLSAKGKKIIITIEQGETRKQAFTSLQKLTNEPLIMLNSGMVVTKAMYQDAYNSLDAVNKYFFDLSGGLIEMEGNPLTESEKSLPKGTELVSTLINTTKQVNS